MTTKPNNNDCVRNCYLPNLETFYQDFHHEVISYYLTYNIYPTVAYCDHNIIWFGTEVLVPPGFMSVVDTDVPDEPILTAIAGPGYQIQLINDFDLDDWEVVLRDKKI